MEEHTEDFDDSLDTATGEIEEALLLERCETTAAEISAILDAAEGNKASSFDDPQPRILMDPFHFFQRIYLSKKHGATGAFLRALSDAIYVVSLDDKHLMSIRLAKAMMTFDEATRSPAHAKYIWKRVRRTIPPPSVLEPLVREIFETFGSLLDAKTKQPLFNKAALLAAKRCLELVRKGQLSDPAGIELYTDLGPCRGPDGTADDGVRLFSCRRGTNGLEGGIHRNLRARFAKSGVTPRHANARLLDYVLGHNLTVGTYNRTEVAFTGHFDLWLTLDLYRLRQKTAHLLPVRESTASKIIDPTLYAESSERLGVARVDLLKSSQSGLNLETYVPLTPVPRSEPLEWKPRSWPTSTTLKVQRLKLRHDWLAERQGTRFAILHVHSPKERALFKYLLSRVPPDWSEEKRVNKITRDWNQYANGDGVFYKMPEHIITWMAKSTTLANAQATLAMAGYDIKTLQKKVLDSDRAQGVDILPAKPLIGLAPPTLGRRSEAEVVASEPQTVAIQAFQATGAASLALTADDGVEGARKRRKKHCRSCGRAECRAKGLQGSGRDPCRNPCADCGRAFGESDEMIAGNPPSQRFCPGEDSKAAKGKARKDCLCPNASAAQAQTSVLNQTVS